jgi:hypothetical protein
LISAPVENFIAHGFTDDTHENDFGTLKDCNGCLLDMGFAALLEDLEARACSTRR